VQPRIDKSRKRAEKLECERDEKEKKAREEQKALWENDIQKLRESKGFLEHLSSINRFPDTYDPQACHRLLSAIRGRAELIKGPEMQPIQEKLLKFSDKKNSVHSSTMLSELLNIINGKYDKLAPQDLINEIDQVLAAPPK
jgi:hypothetical protein